MSKARIVVEGAVWAGTGYRVFAAAYARHEGANGLVRNLPDGRIEIFYDGSEASMRSLVKDLRGWNTGVNGNGIRRIDVCAEGRRGYEPAWKEYKGFEIDYGAMTPYEQEIINAREWFVIKKSAGLRTSHSVVFPSNSSGFASASAFVWRTVPSMCSGGE
jgi:acylphosphatase